MHRLTHRTSHNGSMHTLDSFERSYLFPGCFENHIFSVSELQCPVVCFFFLNRLTLYPDRLGVLFKIGNLTLPSTSSSPPPQQVVPGPQQPIVPSSIQWAPPHKECV